MEFSKGLKIKNIKNLKLYFLTYLGKFRIITYRMR